MYKAISIILGILAGVIGLGGLLISYAAIHIDVIQPKIIASRSVTREEIIKQLEMVKNGYKKHSTTETKDREELNYLINLANTEDVHITRLAINGWNQSIIGDYLLSTGKIWIILMAVALILLCVPLLL